jgi:hypothetical protein
MIRHRDSAALAYDVNTKKTTDEPPDAAFEPADPESELIDMAAMDSFPASDPPPFWNWRPPRAETRDPLRIRPKTPRPG